MRWPRAASRGRTAGIGGVGIAVEKRRRLDLVGDAVEAGSQRGGETEVGVAVGSGNAALDSQARTFAHHSKAGGAVVVAPGQARGRPRTGAKALVGIHGGRVEDHEFGRVGDPAAQKPAKRIAAENRAQRALSGHDVSAVLPETHVHVTARSGLRGVGLRHERDAHAQAVGDFLEALFEDGVAVGHGQYVGVSHVQFVLPLAPLALGAFHRDARLRQVTADRAVQLFFARSLQDVIILQVPSGGFEAVVAGGGGLTVGVVEDVILQLGTGHRLISHLRRPARFAAARWSAAPLPPTRGNRAEARRRSPAPCGRANWRRAGSPGRRPCGNRRSRAPSWRIDSPATGPSPCRW